jgi:hypothetical protein
MPKELRKRGKRAKKTAREKDEDSYIVYAKPEDSKLRAAAVGGDLYVEEDKSGRAAAAEVAAQEDGVQQQNTQPPERESIWPLLDADTKAYFKQLEDKIIGLEELNANGRAPIIRRDGNGYEDDEDDAEPDGAPDCESSSRRKPC